MNKEDVHVIFREGDHVEVKSGSGEWLPGVIKKVVDNKKCEVSFNNEEFGTATLPVAWIRLQSAQKTVASPPPNTNRRTQESPRATNTSKPNTSSLNDHTDESNNNKISVSSTSESKESRKGQSDQLPSAKQSSASTTTSLSTNNDKVKAVTMAPVEAAESKASSNVKTDNKPSKATSSESKGK